MYALPLLHRKTRVEARGHVPDKSATSSAPLSPVADQESSKKGTGTEVELLKLRTWLLRSERFLQPLTKQLLCSVDYVNTHQFKSVILNLETFVTTP